VIEKKMKKKIKIEKSRILLKQALIHLLLEKSYTSISIQELCKEAKVGRSTFYNHYHDKRDLLESTVAYYSRIAQETTLTAFLNDDNLDLRSNLIRDYETTAKFSYVIQALLKVHLPNADFEANIRQILHDKYQVLLENSEVASIIPEDLAVDLYAANALTVTKYIAQYPDTANIEDLANFMVHIYRHLFKPTGQMEGVQPQDMEAPSGDGEPSEQDSQEPATYEKA